MKNVILITVDALRADHLSLMGYSRETSPFLDRVSEQGTTFVHAFANSSWTAPAFPPIFSSDYPVLDDRYGIEGRVVIQEVLNKMGYETAAFNSNPLLSRYYKYDRGFSYFEDYLDKCTLQQEGYITTSIKKHATKVICKYNVLYSTFSMLNKIKRSLFPIRYRIAAQVLTDDVISWLKYRRNGAFLLWIHYMDTHAPFLHAPSIGKIKGSLNKDELKKRLYRVDISENVCLSYVVDLINKYDSSIRCVDYAIESLFAYLEENRILDNSIVIITADHGEEFLDHGNVGHFPKLYDELIHVPLIIKGPDIPKGRRIDKLVQHLDIGPTILDILGFPVPESFLGENVFKVTERHGIISEVSNVGPNVKIEIDLNKLRVAYRSKEWKYIYSEGGEDEFYNLKMDPKETRNILSEHKEKALEFKSRILQHIEMKREILRMLDRRKKLKNDIKELKRKGKI